MTEKRFTTDNGSHEDVCLVDNLTKKEYESNFNDIVDLLNDLSEENEQLKNICKNLINEVNKRGITVTMTDNCKELLE